MLTGLRQRLQRRSRRLLIVVAIVAMVATVALAHSAPADEHMGSAMSVCLALAGTAALGILSLASAAGVRRHGGAWPRPSEPVCPGGSVPAATALPWARGSPHALEVLRL